MTSWKKVINRGQPDETAASETKGGLPIKESHKHDFESSYHARLEKFTSQPRRHPLIHWSAFVLSLFSLGFLAAWMVNPAQPAPFNWRVLDAVLGLVFTLEFFSRSGFRWNPLSYSVSHFFDFMAIVPVLWLTNHGFTGEAVWVWLVLFGRAARVLDRLLGDGFVRRNIFAIAEGLEEEITDRVLIRILDRIQADFERGKFGKEIAGTLERNKPAVLERIATQHPANEGLARLVGLDGILRRAEDNTYESIVNILNSDEVDRTIREAVDSVFDRMREEIGQRTWLSHFGLKAGLTGPHSHDENKPATDIKNNATPKTPKRKPKSSS